MINTQMPHTINGKRFSSLIISALVSTFVMVLVYFLLNQVLDGRVWEGMVVSKSALRVEYCEFNNPERFFHQSINTYSNLVYFFFGILICFIANEDFKNKNSGNRMQQFPELSMLMGLSFIYLCFGSSFFHASLTWLGQRVDMNGVYALNIVLATIALYHIFHRITLSKRSKNLLISLLVILILVFYQVHLMISSGILLPAFIISIWVLTTINYFQFRQKRSLLTALSSFVIVLIAFKVRQLDVDKVGCDPLSIFQGHSLWHLLTGISCFCGYAFFRFSKT
jgi:Ceramidase